MNPGLAGTLTQNRILSNSDFQTGQTENGSADAWSHIGGKNSGSDLSAAMASDAGCLRTGLLERAVILRWPGLASVDCAGLAAAAAARLCCNVSCVNMCAITNMTNY